MFTTSPELSALDRESRLREELDLALKNHVNERLAWNTERKKLLARITQLESAMRFHGVKIE